MKKIIRVMSRAVAADVLGLFRRGSWGGPPEEVMWADA